MYLCFFGIEAKNKKQKQNKNKQRNKREKTKQKQIEDNTNEEIEKHRTKLTQKTYYQLKQEKRKNTKCLDHKSRIRTHN
jgi:hypothetical protein